MGTTEPLDLGRCHGCGKWLIREVLCEACAYIYARLIA